jgi:hypothetical protein
VGQGTEIKNPAFLPFVFFGEKKKKTKNPGCQKENILRP